tara:strand:+ start:25764 stop:25979 length:216 start_codon:yes stop_codon:yes gene_type:complete
MTRYFIVSEIDLKKDYVEAMAVQGKAISGKELIEMNSAAKIEMARGHTHLNKKLITATEHHVRKELGELLK